METLKFVSQAVKCIWLSLIEVTKPLSSKQPGEEKDSGTSISTITKIKQKKHNGPFTREEVANHSSTNDCWIIIKNKVYDVTEFGWQHPGGNVIFGVGGRDATDQFSAFHALETWSHLKNFYIGDIVEFDKDKELEIIKDFRKMRSEFIAKGYFNSDKLFYIMKSLMNFSIFLTSYSILYSYHENIAGFLLSAFLLAVFWQQMGWLTHDFVHHQVFKNRKWNNFIGYIYGNICQGFSVDWWKRKHNTHHALPNEITDTNLALDPDIDTLPILAWSTDQLKTISENHLKLILKYQHYLFFIILLFARLSWAQQSFSHALELALKKSNGYSFEFILILFHYALHFILAYFYSHSLLKALLFIFTAQIFGGFMLGFSFVQSHNGMEIYRDEKDFVTAQVISTRDIAFTVFVDWFMGGLNYQIEHHLFPTMPRHNLRKIQKHVMELCSKHNLAYEECSMPIGTKRVVQRLADVSKHL